MKINMLYCAELFGDEDHQDIRHRWSSLTGYQCEIGCCRLAGVCSSAASEYETMIIPGELLGHGSAQEERCYYYIQGDERCVNSC